MTTRRNAEAVTIISPPKRAWTLPMMRYFRAAVFGLPFTNITKIPILSSRHFSRKSTPPQQSHTQHMYVAQPAKHCRHYFMHASILTSGYWLGSLQNMPILCFQVVRGHIMHNLRHHCFIILCGHAKHGSFLAFKRCSYFSFSRRHALSRECRVLSSFRQHFATAPNRQPICFMKLHKRYAGAREKADVIRPSPYWHAEWPLPCRLAAPKYCAAATANHLPRQPFAGMELLGHFITFLMPLLGVARYE